MDLIMHNATNLVFLICNSKKYINLNISLRDSPNNKRTLQSYVCKYNYKIPINDNPGNRAIKIYYTRLNFHCNWIVVSKKKSIFWLVGWGSARSSSLT